jgi:hypothetical protein
MSVQHIEIKKDTMFVEGVGGKREIVDKLLHATRGGFCRLLCKEKQLPGNSQSTKLINQ